MRTAALCAALLLAACGGETGDDDVNPIFDLPQINPLETPICLSYEPTTLDTTRNYTSLLRNDGRQQMIVETATITGDERGHFELAGIEPSVVNSFEFTHAMIRYRPTVEGWDTALLTVRSNAQNYPEFSIFILALGRPANAPDTWDPGPKPDEALVTGEEACKNDYEPRQ